MNHWIVAPVILPALVGPLLAWVMRFDIVLARTVSMASTVALTAISIGLFVLASDGDVHVYQLGNWAPPFGIMLVVDRLSAMLLVLTSLLALMVLMHVSATGWDTRGRHFHALFQFQLMGIYGAFLTGDAFNLFVFFEVLLIASYGLMLHGGGRKRLKAGLQYVIMNLAGSTLFLFALGTIYATLGTLNLADIAIRVREVPVEDAALVRVAAILLMVVFAVKAAIFPVQFWLPNTYSNAPAPVAALFAIMTKVGAYAILRFYTVGFGPDVEATGSMPGDWLFWGAFVTTIAGAVGALGSRRMMSLLSFSVIFSMGTLMLAVSAFTPESTVAAIYYLLHSTFAAAALFLLADLVVSRRPEGDVLRAYPVTVQNGLFAALFFGAAIGMAGMPPLSGFLGKLLVLDAVYETSTVWYAWAAILGGSVLTIVAFAKAGSSLFWKSTAKPPESHEPGHVAPVTTPASIVALAPTVSAIAMLALLSAFAGPVAGYLEATAEQLYNPEQYMSVIAQPEEGG